MPRFEDHIAQSQHNLDFLGRISTSVPNCLDWQVTACFYAGLHLINAHLAKKDRHFQSHWEVAKVINPAGSFKDLQIDHTAWEAYRVLQNLSRISRYLVNPAIDDDSQTSRIRQRHLKKALRNLDILIDYFSPRFNFTPHKPKVNCTEFSVHDSLNWFDLALNSVQDQHATPTP